VWAQLAAIDAKEGKAATQGFNERGEGGYCEYDAQKQ
jgi:hypothetical protein